MFPRMFNLDQRLRNIFFSYNEQSAQSGNSILKGSSEVAFPTKVSVVTSDMGDSISRIISPSSQVGAVSRNSNNSTHNDSGPSEWTLIAIDLLKFSLTIGVTAYFSYRAFGLIKNMVTMMNTENTQEKEVKKSLAKRLKRPDIVNMSFNSYEARLMTDVLGSDEITVSFADVGGLEMEVEEVFDSIVFPIQFWNHQNKEGVVTSKSSDAPDDMTVCPTGVLLYGAPGTGKTLIAKAIAKESGATFINIKASSVMDKWFGESDRLVSALFSLARKLGPSIVFIDEIETLLRKRDGSLNNPALTTLQGVFLAEWDGLVAERKENTKQEKGELPPPPAPISAKNPGPKNDLVAGKKVPPVVVLGATNRPSDIDAAFLRRMPVQIRTHMPNAAQRFSILSAMLREENLADDVSLQSIAQQTEGYSGSDLRELVRLATLQRMKEMKQSFRQKFRSTPVKNDLHAGAAMDNVLASHQENLKRPLTSADFAIAFDKTKSTVLNTRQFNEEVHQNDRQSSGRHLVDDIKAYAEFASMLSSLSSETKTK